jgi:hypothetical protein
MLNLSPDLCISIMNDFLQFEGYFVPESKIKLRTTDSIFILKSLITKISCKREKKNICIFVELLTLFGTMDYLYKLMENGIGSFSIFTAD